MHRPALHGIRGIALGLAAAAAIVAVAAWTVADLRRSGDGDPAAGVAEAPDQPERIVAARGLHDAVSRARDEVAELLAPAMGRATRIAQRDGIESAFLRGDQALLRRTALRELELGGAGDALAFIDAAGSVIAFGSGDAAGAAGNPGNRGMATAFAAPAGVRCASLAGTDIGKELWNDGSASIACVAPVAGPTGTAGAVVVLVRVERVLRALDAEEALGIELTIIDGRGAPVGSDPTPCAAAGGPALRGLALGLRDSGAHAATVDAPGGVAHAAELPWAAGGELPHAYIAGVADSGAVAGELGHARMVGVATAASIASLGLLAVGLLVQSRTQRRAQVALVSARNEADAASRSKTEFLANMSHEIRTPMTAILGYVDLLADHGDLQPGAPSREEAVDTIRRNARHLLALINDILDLSKIEAGQMSIDRQRVRVMDLVQDALRLMDDRARQKGIALRLAVDGDVPETITTDPTRLRQVLINLLGNAVKFTEQGSVTLTLRRQDGVSGRIAFEIADTGIGMTPEQLSRLYQPFVQADSSTTRRYGGTGLGLAITRRCTDLLGGTIAVRSVPGTGSTFTVTIDAGDVSGVQPIRLRPAADAPADGALRLPSAVRQPLSGIRVLLAEDGPDNQRLIRFHLERAGARVDVAENGAKALERVRDCSRLDRYDVVLMDMQMPVMDGYEAVRRLVAAGERLPVIALTAHAMPGDRERCIEAGCTEYLCKPVDPRALIAGIRHAIAPGATVCTSVRRMHGEDPDRAGPPSRAAAG